MKMKRFIALLTALLLCLPLASCDLDGIGINKGRDDTNGRDAPETTGEWVDQGTLSAETEIEILVDWSDFVRVNGISYNGHFENRVIDGSRVGEKLGEILYRVKSSYSSHEEMNAASNRDFTASFRPIGSEIFAIKDDEDSIAVLDGGKYYLYTHKEDYSIPFVAFGGERYSLPGTDEINRGITVNTFDQLCEAWGGAENIPTEILNHYSDDTLSNISLVIVELISGWGGTEFGIRSVSKSGDDLLVDAVELNSDGVGDCAMHYWTFFIEIPKTDDKEVKISLNTVKPLEIDSELSSISSSEMNNYICYDPEVDYGRYEGKAVYNKAVAEELVRSSGEYSGYSAFVRFCPTNNYWLVSLSRFGEKSSHIVETVVRAADGKIISQIEAIGCS